MKKSIFLLLFTVIILAAPLLAEELNWQQCVTEAARNSPSVISAKERLNQARAQSWMSASSAFPQISASASGSKSGNEPGPNATPSIIGGVSYNPANNYSQSYSYGLTARQVIFDGFNNTQQILKASEDLKAAELSYKISSAQIRFDLKQSYASLMKAQKMVDITAKISDIRKKQYNDLRLRYNSGTENRGNLMNSNADMKQSEFEAGQALRNLELAKLDLADKMGRVKSDDIAVKENFTAVEDATKDPDFKALFDSNFNQLLAAAQLRSAGFTLGSAVSSMLPTVSLNGSLGRGGSIFVPQNTQWSFGANISFSIFDGGKSAAEIAQASAAMSQAKADETSAEQKAYAGLRTAWYGFKDAVTNIGVQQMYLDATVERAKIADAQYTTGLLDFNNWSIIQNSLVSTEKSFVTSQAQLLISEAAWIQAKGGTLEDEDK
jgi:outer membrane protein TolC